MLFWFLEAQQVLDSPAICTEEWLSSKPFKEGVKRLPLPTTEYSLI